MDTKRLIAAPLMLAALSGCASLGTLCTAGPIILHPDDILTRSTSEQITAIDEAGEEVCNWQAPR